MRFNKGELYCAKICASVIIEEIVEITETSNSEFCGISVYSINNKRPVGLRWALPISELDTYFTIKQISKEENPEYFL